MKPAAYIINPCNNQDSYFSDVIESAETRIFANDESTIGNNGTSNNTANFAEYEEADDKLWRA